MVNQTIMFGTILLIAIVVIMLLFVGGRTEGFETYGAFIDDRNAYINESKRRYNPLAEITDIQGTNLAASGNAEKINADLAVALMSSEIVPSTSSPTLTEISPVVSKAVIPTTNKILSSVQKCEEMQSRDSCKILDNPDYDNCGVCIKAGSPVSYKNPNKHIGGLLLLPEEKKNARAKAAATNSSPDYIPSLGECPGGYFFADRAECEKQANRLDCEESGKTGGFEGKTIEGNVVADKKCVQILNGNDDVFIYDPKDRAFSVNLRVVTPIGTGACEVSVYNEIKRLIGYKKNATAGKEFIVTLENVKENEQLHVVVSMDDLYTTYVKGKETQICAILLQWENAVGTSKRKIAFEPTIVAINGSGPSSTENGINSFSALKRYGSYMNSSTIKNPSYSSASKILGSNFWIWDNVPMSTKLQFTAVVPGIFLDSYYVEDREISSNGMMIGSAESGKMLKSSPCAKSGQKPGAYNLDCLRKLFAAAGGDIHKGYLVTKKGGLMQLNTIGSLSDIRKYLENLFSIATTGKNKSGATVGKSLDERRKLINDASKKMFGFEIASPCENVTHNFEGKIVIAPKTGKDIGAKCLDYLWANAGSEEEFGKKDAAKTIKHTYTHIGERYSGLRNSEGNADLLRAHPFTLCQRSGTGAPISKTGKVNATVLEKAQSLGNIPEIQRYYDSIYNSANNSSVSPDKKRDAIKQCYGITKLGSTTTEGFANKPKSRKRSSRKSRRSSRSSRGSRRSSRSSRGSSRSSRRSRRSSRSSSRSRRSSRSSRRSRRSSRGSRRSQRKRSPKFLTDIVKRRASRGSGVNNGKHGLLKKRRSIKKPFGTPGTVGTLVTKRNPQTGSTERKFIGEHTGIKACSGPNPPEDCFKTMYSSPHSLSAASRHPLFYRPGRSSRSNSSGSVSSRSSSKRRTKFPLIKSKSPKSRRSKSSRSRRSKSSRSRRSKSSRSRRSKSPKSRRSKSSRSRSKSSRSRSKSSRSSSKSSRSSSKSPRRRSKSPRSRSKSPRSRSKSPRSRSKSPKNRIVAPRKGTTKGPLIGMSLQNSKLAGASL